MGKTETKYLDTSGYHSSVCELGISFSIAPSQGLAESTVVEFERKAKRKRTK